jgi:hypothetical protein
MDRSCSTHGRDQKCVEIFVEKSEGKRSLGRPRHKWKNNIRMDLREIEWGVMNWIHLVQGRNQCWALVNKVMNIWVP